MAGHTAKSFEAHGSSNQVPMFARNSRKGLNASPTLASTCFSWKDREFVAGARSTCSTGKMAAQLGTTLESPVESDFERPEGLV